MAVNYGKWFMVGAIAGALNQVLLWLVSLVPSFADSLKSQITGINTDLANYVTGLLSGIITLPGILIASIGGGLLVMLGAAMYQHKFLPKDVPILKGTYEQLVFTLIYGAAFASILLVGLQLPAWTTIIAMIINALVTAFFINELLVKRIKLIKIP